jgi:AraC-like DNA-binding protein
MDTATPFPASANASSDRLHQDLVAQLQRSALFRDYQKSFEITTGLPLTIRGVGSFQPPWHGARRTNAFCAMMASRNKTCSACLQMQQRMEAEARDGARSFECFAGLSDSAVPVRVGDQVVAFLQTGQVMLRPPSKARFRQTLRQVAGWGEKIDEAQLRKTYFATRVLPRRHYDSILLLLSIFAQHLSSLSNQLMMQQAAEENPVVTRARQFIAEHHGEEISLGQLAQAVHMSRFYFCKVFKEGTGLTFVEYLARARVETVKKLLLNPHKRMSESAYEAGFQSLSQFNRIFRRFVGESPTGYRRRLPGSGPDPLSRAA